MRADSKYNMDPGKEFVQAMEFGMPPMMGLEIDRFVMFLCSNG